MSATATPTRTLDRRRLLGLGAIGAAAGAVGLTFGKMNATADAASQESAQLGEIYRLQAAFHRAKTTQAIELMMSLWADGATFNMQGDANSPYVGTERLRAFWLGSGSFKNRRFSLVPSYKTQIHVTGDTATLYFECHDVGDYDLPTRAIASDSFLSGTLRRIGGEWLFWDMTAGKSSPLSVDHFYS